MSFLMRTVTIPVHRATLAILTALSLAAPASAQTRQGGPIRIYNFAKVNDTYYRGGQPVGGDYADLAALGVKTIINLTSDEDDSFDEREEVEKNGMRYVHIPMSTRRAPTDAELTTFLAVVTASVSQPVYVHCVGGRHRTGVMTAVYRMIKDGLSGAEAFAEMKKFKYGPDFLHPEFKKFVYEYGAKRDGKRALATHTGG
jgi:protein tyrosine/serine phosphatase